MIDKQLQVSNYVYNKTINYINKNKIDTISKFDLSNKLVTYKTQTTDDLYISYSKQIADLKKKKLDYKELSEEFANAKKHTIPYTYNKLKSWERDVDKDIRSGSVFEACKNIQTCKKNVKSGLIKFFKMKYRTKKAGKYSMVLKQSMFKLQDNKIYLKNKNLDDKLLRFSKRNNKYISTLTNLKDSKILKRNGKYYLALAIDIVKSDEYKTGKFIGIDPGVRTFLSCYSDESALEFAFDNSITDNLDKLKTKLKKKHVRKRILNKIDDRKANVINELHWKSINYLVKNYDYIMLEKFESQGFVKHGSNKTLNRQVNNLKPFLFRQRLLYKAACYNKKVKIVDARYTTKTCSNCGIIQDIGANKIYNCNNCKLSLERDFNAAKNILLKGLLN